MWKTYLTIMINGKLHLNKEQTFNHKVDAVAYLNSYIPNNNNMSIIYNENSVVVSAVSVYHYGEQIDLYTGLVVFED